MRQVEFISSPMNWRKEHLNIKCNTARFFEGNDQRKELLDLYISQEISSLIVCMKNSKTGEVFRRMVTDVSILHGCYIISWQPMNYSYMPNF